MKAINILSKISKESHSYIGSYTKFELPVSKNIDWLIKRFFAETKENIQEIRNFKKGSTRGLKHKQTQEKLVKLEKHENTYFLKISSNFLTKIQ